LAALRVGVPGARARRPVDDREAAARRVGSSRARITQIVNLTLLAPAIQERILIGEIDFAERVIR
jgi:hypothetical protein